MSPEEAAPKRDADHSILYAGRLAAYVWLSDGGHLRRAGANDEAICAIGFAEIVVFDAERLELLTRTIKGSEDFGALCVNLGIEEFRVQRGAFKPAAHVRQF